MQSITTIGLDIAKSVFQVHGIDGGGQVVMLQDLCSYSPARAQQAPPS
jgi:transposase